jgi:hypothetical protein
MDSVALPGDFHQGQSTSIIELNGVPQRQRHSQVPYLKNTRHKKGLVEWLK